MQSEVGRLSFGGNLDACGKGAIRSLEVTMVARAVIGRSESLVGQENCDLQKIVLSEFGLLFATRQVTSVAKEPTQLDYQNCKLAQDRSSEGQ